MSSSNKLVSAGGFTSAGFFAGFFAGPDDALLTLKWLAAFIGPLGFLSVLMNVLLACGAYLVFVYFANQKEADEKRWNDRFLQQRNDTKEAFNSNAAALDRVTSMLATSAGMTMPKSQ
tara:strand:- start:5179 stop:5532 length:354 start_codon:yes stop_codon:yes gene_type:complete